MNLPTILANLEDLPPTPQILPRLHGLLNDPNTDQSDLVALLRMDSGLTARIIRLANSAYFGSAQPAENLSQAVTRLGYRDVYRVTSLAISSEVLGAALPTYRLEAGELVERSLACATALSSFRPSAAGDSETRYTVGLLHGLGKIVVNHYFLRRGLEVYSDDPDHTLTPAEERELLGFDHAEAGAEVLRQWHFPDRICQAIAEQYAPLQAPEPTPLACQLWVARWAVPLVRRGTANTPLVFDGNPQILETAGLDRADLAEGLEAAAKAFGEARDMMRAA